VGQAIVFRGLPAYKQRRRPEAILRHTLLKGGRGFPGGPHYFDGVAAVTPLVFLGVFLAFFKCFLALAVTVAACGEVLAVAGVACANVRGIVATARAIASSLVFIFPSFRRVSSARSQFHVAPEAREAR
jgi:hypothetical protein